MTSYQTQNNNGLAYSMLKTMKILQKLKHIQTKYITAKKQTKQLHAWLNDNKTTHRNDEPHKMQQALVLLGSV